mmetsp:Transcript_787/g.1171  ORF Transcript_787/g.1171 Transcript_787/m.1171 type:complete len:111 (+) Transcript_787:298-630(+)
MRLFLPHCYNPQAPTAAESINLSCDKLCQAELGCTTMCQMNYLLQLITTSRTSHVLPGNYLAFAAAAAQQAAPLLQRSGGASPHPAQPGAVATALHLPPSCDLEGSAHLH